MVEITASLLASWNGNLKAAKPAGCASHGNAHGDFVGFQVERAGADGDATDAVDSLDPRCFQRCGVVDGGIEVERAGGAAEDKLEVVSGNVLARVPSACSFPLGLTLTELDSIICGQTDCAADHGDGAGIGDEAVEEHRSRAGLRERSEAADAGGEVKSAAGIGVEGYWVAAGERRGTRPVEIGCTQSHWDTERENKRPNMLWPAWWLNYGNLNPSATVDAMH